MVDDQSVDGQIVDDDGDEQELPQDNSFDTNLMTISQVRAARLFDVHGIELPKGLVVVDRNGV